MKGVVLAGGKGTRLHLLTAEILNKHLLPVGREPMIFNPIKQLISADIKEILIITGKEHIEEMEKILGSGKEFGCDFTFRIQEEPRGIADALFLAKNFIGGDLLTVILGDNITTHSIKPYVEDFKKQGKGAKIFLTKVREPQNFGIAKFEGKKIIRIVEKPEITTSNLAVVGIYMYDNSVFDIIRGITPSPRGELEITSVNNRYLEIGQLSYGFLDGNWTDAGTFETYKYASKLLSEINNTIIKR